MRNRQLIARWTFEKGAADKVVELVKKDGKTYVKINDYQKLRNLVLGSCWLRYNALKVKEILRLPVNWSKSMR